MSQLHSMSLAHDGPSASSPSSNSTSTNATTPTAGRHSYKKNLPQLHLNKMKLPKLSEIQFDLPKPLKVIKETINMDDSSTTKSTAFAKKTTSGRGQQVDEQKTQREQIQEELLAQAKSYLKNFEKYEISLDKPERKYQARKFIDPDGVAGYVIKFHCDGFNRTHYEKGKENPVDLTIALNNLSLSAERLADDEGREVYLLHEKIPIFFINNRSWVTVFYYEDAMDETGHSWMIDSSKRS